MENSEPLTSAVKGSSAFIITSGACCWHGKMKHFFHSPIHKVQGVTEWFNEYK